ncbi:MAG: metallophosphoesterase [Verrucomicrobiota bacterium]
MNAPLIALILIAVLWSTLSVEGNGSVTLNRSDLEPPTESIALRFVFVGCNRIAYDDRTHSNASLANVPTLKRILNEVAGMEREPDLLFMLGDLILGETNTTDLNSQLEAWVQQYEDTSFSDIQSSGVELVAVPGNHEMLYYDDASGQEYPLAGAIDVWLKHMTPYLPKDRISDPSDPIVHGATFAFTRGNVVFVIMDTDTYNDNKLEGQVPSQWINQQVEKYAQDEQIEHIFVLGHRPYYVDGAINTGHGGFPGGPTIWPTLQANRVLAMLCAHQHVYDRQQPVTPGVNQITAGHGGTYNDCCTPQFFGYCVIDILTNGDVELTTYGWNVGKPSYGPSSAQTTVRDRTTLTWEANKNPYTRPVCIAVDSK